MNVSRRKLLQVLPVAAAQASAQIAESPANANTNLENARRGLQATAQSVRRVELPQSTEPATRFIPRS
jgi:hypothetical protein